ncbi:MAG: hypothetical protein GXY26_04680 [Clostridiales bacterium]|nr:hypothetical protein [Clostridiales bacterium]
MDCYKKCNAEDNSGESCVTYTYQSASVSVPVVVKPKATTGDINTFCCGEPKVSPSPYKITCCSKSGICSFILTQNICVEIPLEISAEAFTGCPYIKCGDVSDEFCEDCGR